MMRVRSSTPAFVALALALCAAGCNKDKPKPADEHKVEGEPVPSGLVFNDFLPNSGTAAVGVRDAGGDGGLGTVAAGGAGGEEPPPEAPGGEADKLAVKVTEPGAEPRAVRKYTFVANKVDKRIISVTQSMTESAGGQSMPPREITQKIHLDLTVKQVKPTGATFEAKVTKVEVPGAPPQLVPVLASMNGVKGTFDVTSSGEVGEVSFLPTQALQANAQLAQQVLEGLSQSIQLLLAPLPTTAVGVGAKWEIATKTEAEQGAKRFTLKEVSNESGVVESDIEIKVPRRAAQAQRGGPPMFVEVDGRGHYKQELRFNQTSPKADGELTVNQKIEVNDPKAGGKQTVIQSTKAKQLIESPAK